MNKLKFVLFICLFASTSVFAAPQWCTGTITTLYQDAGGQLVVNGTWRGDHTVICNVLAERDGIKTEVCKNWLSMAMTAYVTGKEVIVHYSDEDSCAALPKYTASPSPIYVMLK